MQSDSDNFLGHKLGLDNHCTVVGRSSSMRSGQYYYKVYCEVCAKDKEMFGDGIFESAKGNLLKGFIPCACNKSFQQTQKQASLSVERYIRSRNKPYLFKGFVGEYSGKGTKLQLYCCACRKEWLTTTYKSFVSNHTGCPDCGKKLIGEKSTKSDLQMIDSFMATGAFAEGTKFTKSKRVTKAGCRSFWNMYCPTCSNDEYVSAGVCSGIFEAFSGSFQVGPYLADALNPIITLATRENGK